MIEIGKSATLVVRQIVPAGYRLEAKGDPTLVLLPKKLAGGELQIGQEVLVFVYTDSEDRPVATTQTPLAKVGDFALLKVVDQSPHGAFLDWGLDKDLFVPLAEQHDRLVVGRSYVVAVFLDTETSRVAAASRLGPFFNYDLSKLKLSQAVDLLVYGRSELGVQVIVDDEYSGLIYNSEHFVELQIGQRLKGTIQKLREDNKLDIHLGQVGAKGRKDDREVVLSALAESSGVLPLGDKSDPAVVYSRLGISKKSFKAAVGGLFKEGLVVPGPSETRLKTPKS